MKIHHSKPIPPRTVVRDVRNECFIIIGHVGHCVTAMREGGTIEVLDTRNVSHSNPLLTWQEIAPTQYPRWINNFFAHYPARKAVEAQVEETVDA